jgi:hypothetical protein
MPKTFLDRSAANNVYTPLSRKLALDGRELEGFTTAAVPRESFKMGLRVARALESPASCAVRFKSRRGAADAYVRALAAVKVLASLVPGTGCHATGTGDPIPGTGGTISTGNPVHGCYRNKLVLVNLFLARAMWTNNVDLMELSVLPAWDQPPPLLGGNRSPYSVD